MVTKKNTTINGSDYFRITRTIEGKKKQFYGASKTDAERKYKLFLEETARKKYTFGSDSATLGERAEEYVENVLKVSQKYARGTIRTYIGAYKNHIKGTSICNVPVNELKPMDLQRFYNSLNVSQQTLKRIHKFMRAFWNWLVLSGFTTDILSSVEMPRKKDNGKSENIIVWEESEIAAIINALETAKTRHRLRFMVYTLLYTGMRISEVLGLKYGDIKEDCINVQRQYYLNELKPPKFESTRTIPMHDVLKKQFTEHEQWHRGEMEKRGYKTDFVFTTLKGTLYDSSAVRKALRRFYDANNIPYKHIHTYRATFCTQLCRCDVPLEVASKLLGHKSLDVTARHYALIRQDTIIDAINNFKYL